MATEGMKRWAGRVALVTGASTGIGEGICRELVKQGMKVIGCARDEAKLKKLSQELAAGPGQMVAMRCDLSTEQDISTMFENIRNAFGRLDVCVNNACLANNSPLLTHETADDWRKTMEVNVIAACICSREAIKIMKAQNISDGQIIQIDCIIGRRFPEGALDGLNFFCATKSALRTITDGLRREVRKSSTPEIRVASITPGAVETEFTARSINKETADGIYTKVQCLKPEDIAKAVTYILEAPPHVEINEIVLQPVSYTI